MAVKDTTVTLTIEMVGVGIALSAGFVHLLEAWPAPWVPLVWMSSVLIFFSAYRAGVFVKAKFFPAPEPDPEQEQAGPSNQRSSMPSLKWSAVEPNTPTQSDQAGTPAEGVPGADKIQIPAADGALGDSEMATIGLPQVAVGPGSEDPTAFLDAAELREETEDDVSAPKVSLPAFAESTMSLDERELALHTMQMEAVGAGAPAQGDKPDPDGPTEPMQSVGDAVDGGATEAIDPATLGQAPAAPQDGGATEAIDPATLGQTSEDTGATERMAAVDQPEESPKTEALDEKQLRERFGGEVPEASKAPQQRRISSPRKPFQKNQRREKPSEDSSNQEASESSPGAEAQQSVRMLDADQLRALQRKLDQQGEGDD
jgi:hypothetical protein